jgi:Protein of unknown function (DUF938)
MNGAARILGKGGPLVMYGPFRRKDCPIEPSNAAFDSDLRRRDPRWGLRWAEEIDRAAQNCGFKFNGLIEMPANNLSIIYRLS